ncbi:hypothetical protein H0H93_013067 [Arthromyces matolae]|nr:hypothetical protein H0H93_013067 [Arthromyces matolae]
MADVRGQLRCNTPSPDRSSLIGPPVGGTVYSRFGFRGPFIFGIIWTVVDLIARLLIIERKEAIRWGLDPQNRNALPAVITNSDDGQAPTVAIKNGGQTGHEQLDQLALGVPPCIPDDQSIRQTSSLALIFLRLTRSSRAVVAFIMTFAYGVLYTIQEPTLPVHLQHIWGLTSAQVGLVFFASVIPTLLCEALSSSCNEAFPTFF